MAAGASPPVFGHLANGNRKYIPVMSQKGPRFVYVANFGSKTVSEYRIGPHGGLSPIGTIKAGSGPYRICTDPAGPYVYVLNRGTFTAAGSIYAYQVGRHGLLRKIGEVSKVSGSDMTIGPHGRRLYVVEMGAIAEYAIGSGGALKRTKAVSPMRGIKGIGIDATGRYLFAVHSRDPNSNTCMLYEYAIASDGALAAVGSRTLGTSVSLAINPAGPYIYVGSILWNGRGFNPQISVYVIGHDGVLMPVQTIHTKNLALSMAASRGGRYLYASFSNNSVSKYRIGAGGTLRVMGNAPTERLPMSIVVGVNGHIYVANGDSNTISKYAARANGSLAAPRVIVALRPNASLTFTPADGRHLYIVQHGWPPPRPVSSIFEYTVGPKGALTKSPKVVATPSISPIQMAAGGRYAYQWHGFMGWMLRYRVGSQGQLHPMGHSAVDCDQAMTLDPRGPYGYCVAGNGVAQYAIQSNGQLVKMGQARLGYSSSYLVIDPAGRYLYAGLGDGAIRAYGIGPLGTLKSSGTVHLGKGFFPPFVIDPSGRYAYVVHSHFNSKGTLATFVSEYVIKANGGLARMGRVAVRQLTPDASQIDPRGPYAFLFSRLGGGVCEYKILSGGMLMPIKSRFPGLNDVNDIIMDPTGKYLFVRHNIGPGDGQGPEKTVYLAVSIGPDGDITPISSVATGGAPRSLASTPY
jgi:6-phosphogluconolactonase (cycloisomerase 2 family)